MLRHFQNGGRVCGEGIALWVKKTAEWHCENDINVRIVLLAINRLSFKFMGKFMGKFVSRFVGKGLHCGP